MGAGKVFLITGATGIAAATARLAVNRGDIAFTVAQEDAAEFTGDLREEKTAQAALNAVLHQHGRLDGLFNVAGISGRRFGDGPAHVCTLEGWEAVMASNVRTLFLMSRAVLRHWMESGARGAIVNMSSVSALSPQADHFATHAYAASKGAINSLTFAMAAYYAPHGIRINALAPGLVATPMSARAQSDQRIQEFIREKQPLSGGMLGAVDVASAALFLLSDDARHITGQVLAVDGGWSVTG
ncbi:MAG: SDR family oxidoreductase [Bryobacteraceae bacterium]|nr:SDR family oxidoreductase [Bryobacteraceae bacterium]